MPAHSALLTSHSVLPTPNLHRSGDLRNKRGLVIFVGIRDHISKHFSITTSRNGRVREG